jgi:hypothetical protein
MKLITPLLFATLLSGCVSATVDVDSVCSSKEVSFPGVPIIVSALAGERTASVASNSDMSGTIGKVADIATVTISSVHLNMESSSDLSFLHHVKVTIHSTKHVENELVLSDADFSGLNLPVSVDQDKLLLLLKDGPATVVFTGTGNIPTEATATKTSLCIGISAHADKSLSDISK